MRTILLFLMITGAVLQGQTAPEIDLGPESGTSPKKAMLMSLVLPGAGQAYSGSWLSSALYAGLEIGLAGYSIWLQNKGAEGVAAYEDFADEHWDVQRWFRGDESMDNPGYYANLASNPRTHNVFIMVDGHRYTFFEFIDRYPSVEELPDNFTIYEEYHYYENIGKYKQFKQGWDDYSASSGYETLRRSSPNQERYSGMRDEANGYLKSAAYAGSAIMFNHLLSGLDAYFRTRGINKGIEAGAIVNPDPRNPGTALMVSLAF